VNNAHTANNALRHGFRVVNHLLDYSRLLKADRVEIGGTCRPRSNERQSDMPGLHTWDAAFGTEGFLSPFRRRRAAVCCELVEPLPVLLPDAG